MIHSTAEVATPRTHSNTRAHPRLRGLPRRQQLQPRCLLPWPPPVPTDASGTRAKVLSVRIPGNAIPLIGTPRIVTARVERTKSSFPEWSIRSRWTHLVKLIRRPVEPSHLGHRIPLKLSLIYQTAISPLHLIRRTPCLRPLTTFLFTKFLPGMNRRTTMTDLRLT